MEEEGEELPELAAERSGAVVATRALPEEPAVKWIGRRRGMRVGGERELVFGFSFLGFRRVCVGLEVKDGYFARLTLYY